MVSFKLLEKAEKVARLAKDKRDCKLVENYYRKLLREDLPRPEFAGTVDSSKVIGIDI